MADDDPVSARSEPRAESTSPSASPLARSFTFINADENGNPRRLRHVSQQVAQQHLDNGTMAPDDGPEPGFRGASHGTESMPDQSNEQATVPTTENEDVEMDSKLHTKKEGKKRADSSHAGPSEAPTITRGRKPGGAKKAPPPAWTDLECIALLKVYLNNPESTHNQVAAEHTSTFWANTTHERTGPACMQRYVALFEGVRDRSKIPGIIKALEEKVGGTSDDAGGEGAEASNAAQASVVSPAEDGEQGAVEGDDEDDASEASGDDPALGLNGVDRISVVYFDLSGKGMRTNASEDSFPEDSSDSDDDSDADDDVETENLAAGSESQPT